MNHRIATLAALTAGTVVPGKTFITVFGVVLFSYVLRIPMPVLEWRGL